MTVAEVLLALALVQFTGPDHQTIVINPQMVRDFRKPRATDHFAPGTQCLLFMSDGHFIPVTESCETVRERLEDGKQ